MKLICLSCGCTSYFEVDVEALRALEVNDDGIIVDDAVIDDWNYSDDTLRGNIDDIISYVLKQPNDAIGHDLQNQYVQCARCHSRYVGVPSVSWSPSNMPMSIDEEIHNNRNEYKELHREDNLPVLWQPEKILNPLVGESDL